MQCRDQVAVVVIDLNVAAAHQAKQCSVIIQGIGGLEVDNTGYLVAVARKCFNNAGTLWYLLKSLAGDDGDRAFHLFEKVGQNAGENSVGIGLALAKAIFKAQSGDITVHSQRGIGTRFEIRLFRGVV